MPLNAACLVTILNLSCGFFAIMLELAGHSTAGLVMLLIAFVGDGLDGFVARKTNCASIFGERLDSLSDVICFGVAPAFFALRLHPAWQMDTGAVLALMAYLVCGALRLARYDPAVQKHAFQGMPIPMAGLLLASVSITVGDRPMFLAIPLALGFLMVSDLPFMKLAFKGAKRLLPVLCGLCFVLAMATTQELAVATLGFTIPYVVVNLAVAAVTVVREKATAMR